MRTFANFENGECTVYLQPSDEWEQLLLGALAKGKGELRAIAEYSSEGHFSYGKSKLVRLIIKSLEN